ncbi:MAG: TatD family hydrolase [Candidatus Omnitrophota bacterium]|jgi:TatD DNase family protein
MPYLDSHAHLDFPEYDADRDEVLRRAREGGVGMIFNVGTDPVRSARSLELARTVEGIYGVGGWHPHSAAEVTPEGMLKLEELLTHPKMIAVGEVGLDFYRDPAPRETQIEVFRLCFRMAARLAKPLVIHCRDAYSVLEEVLREEGAPPYRGIMHCFSSEREVMTQFLDMGFHISFSGALTYKKNDALREACKACPKDRIFMETDAPFLAPQPFRGKRNEPVYVLETYSVAAGLLGMPREALGEQTLANAKKLFSL